MPKIDIVDTRATLKPAIIFMKYIGMYRERNEVKSCKKALVNSLQIVYIVVIQILFMAMTAKYVLVVFKEQKLGRLLPLFAISVNSGGITFISLAAQLTFNKNYERFVAAFDDHQRKFGVLKFASISKKMVKVAIIVMLCLSSLYSAWYTYLLYTGKHELENVLFPFNFDNWTNTVVAFTLLLLHQGYQMCHWHAISSIAYYTFIVILIEFTVLATNLKDVMKKHVQTKTVDPDFGNVMETLRQRHLSLINIVGLTNSLVAHLLFAIFTACIPIMCFVLYGTIRGVLSWYELNLIATIALSYLFVPAFTLVVGSFITLKAHEPLSYLVDIDVETVSEKGYRSVSLFISRLTASKIGFTVYEMFTLDVTAILMRSQELEIKLGGSTSGFMYLNATNTMSDKTPERKLVNIGELFRPIITFGKITCLFGGFSKGRGIGNRIIRVVGCFYFAVTQLLIWAMTAKYGVVLFREQDAGRIIPLLALFAFNLGGSYFSFGAFLSFCEKFEELSKDFYNHQKKFGTIAIHRHTTIVLKCNTGFNVASSVSNAIWMCTMYYWFGRKDLERLIYPLNFNTPLSTGISITLLFLHQLFVGSHLNIMAYTSCGMFYIVYATFKTVSKNVQNVVDKIVAEGEPASENVIESFRQEHNSAVQILEHVNTMLRHYLFSIFLTCVPIVLFALYGVIRKLLTRYETFLVMSVAFVYFHQVVIFMVFGALIALQAQSPLDKLLSIDARRISDGGFKSMRLFIDRLKGSVIGFRVYELLTLDTSAILMFVGTLVTYTVVMLQFTTEPQSSDLVSNSTNTTML
ncbi:hypothetical protein LOTGIDRAFT_174896 [Lottia gigantea]|uniref:Gustatory receptor n=1 Tax=Lottia gigantea TaxID=225164 RepID=V3ZXK5_LOTGI|nr:hypothetical protein LOTGIDRAFT_174896 [Lottia gigantea]ESO96278.1 hypothetical protein LOTGIDRAFT_174896 [Lottia gigantea]